MTELDTTAPPQRAAILVGYGAFGRDVLRRLLASTALRGVLVWEEPHGGADPSLRSLRDLGLLWVRDRLSSRTGSTEEDGDQEGSSLEVMRDLYRQIQEVPARTNPEADFAEAIAVAAEKLLSASTRAARRNVLPLGLDIIVLARPTGPEVVGSLDRMLVRGLERLGNNANLERAVQGSEALNFIEILDFENYWDRGDQGRRVREAVHNSVQQWLKRRNEGHPAFGRFYLVDGRTADGMRDAPSRMDEISLFLELLLFEGQRSGELQKLYQSQVALEWPVATFGIRLMERSAGLLSRMAAARFGVGWLAYLANHDAGVPGLEPATLRQKLAPYRPAELDGLLGRDNLRALVGKELDQLESELMALPIELEDWPQRVRLSYEKALRRLETHLAEAMRLRMAEISRERLAQLPEDLRVGIEGDLHDPRSPVPLGTVLKEVEDSLAELGVVEELPPPPGPATILLGKISTLHAEYQRFATDRVHLEGLRRWWMWLAVVLSAATTPLVAELLADVPRPDPASFLFKALQGLSHPWVIGLLLMLGIWGIGHGVLQRGITARIEQARRYYNDPQRGRFVDRLREGLEPGGALRDPIDHFLDRMLLDMAVSVRGEVRRELVRTAARLRERRREMLWLRDQLRELLRLQGLSVDERNDDLGSSLHDGTGIRHSVERGEDFDGMLRSNPPNPERFRSTQAAQTPFVTWDLQYSRAFLYPLAFLDRLSRIYKDPFQQELSSPGAGPEQHKRTSEFLEFLEHRGNFGLAFRWKAQEGVPPDRRYCLLPAIWRQLPGVLPALSGLRVTEESILVGNDVARAYLLRLQTGVEPRCLLESA